jgi:ABC-type glutathione transport system ATPase component
MESAPMNSQTNGDTSAPLLSVRDLSVCFETDYSWVWSNRGVSLDVRPGEIVALVGESGSGKSTVFKAITGLLHGAPGGVSGSIELKGKPIWPDVRKYVRPFDPHRPQKISKNLIGWDKEHRRLLKSVLGKEIGLVFQEPVYSLDPRMTVRQQFEEMLECYDHPYSGGLYARRLIYETLAAMKLDPYEIAQKVPAQLSGGECQRVSLGMAIILQPQLLLCDEPTTAVDLEIRGQLHELLDDYAHKQGNAVLLITHYWPEVRRLADRVVFMDGGQTLEWVALKRMVAQQTEQLHPGTAHWQGRDAESTTRGRVRAAGEAFPDTDACPFVHKCGPALVRGGSFAERCTAGPVPTFELADDQHSRCWLFEDNEKVERNDNQ